MSLVLEAIEKEIHKDAIKINFRAGDLIKVYTESISKGKVVEKSFEGVCIRVRTKTFLVRKTCGNFSVEIDFHILAVTKVNIIRCGKVRRAALYYLRERSGKSAKIAEDFGRKEVYANN